MPLIWKILKKCSLWNHLNPFYSSPSTTYFYHYYMLIALGYWNTVCSAHLVCNMQYAILARLRYAHRGLCDIHGIKGPLYEA